MECREDNFRMVKERELRVEGFWVWKGQGQGVKKRGLWVGCEEGVDGKEYGLGDRKEV